MCCVIKYHTIGPATLVYVIFIQGCVQMGLSLYQYVLSVTQSKRINISYLVLTFVVAHSFYNNTSICNKVYWIEGLCPTFFLWTFGMYLNLEHQFTRSTISYYQQFVLFYLLITVFAIHEYNILGYYIFSPAHPITVETLCLMLLHLFHDDDNLHLSNKATKMKSINQTSFSFPF